MVIDVIVAVEKTFPDDSAATGIGNFGSYIKLLGKSGKPQGIGSVIRLGFPLAVPQLRSLRAQPKSINAASFRT